MTVVRASDEVTDAIALIEMQRQYMEKESGLATACNEALRKLHELLNQETAATQPSGPGGGHTVNVEAVMIEIKRVKKMAGIGSQNIILKHSRPGRQKQAPRPNGSRNPARDRGRRTMGRRGDR
ncbi:MAG TPA: hypothetical protein VGQ88_11455 [Burkholderiales bacterium]|nr:hypothetical protein [Burkholderiales bacterium]